MCEICELDKMRHSLSHVLAFAVQEIYPDTKFGIGPAVKDGFYYDMDFGDMKISETDLEKIELKMREIIAKDLPIIYSEKNFDEAIEWARSGNRKYKEELILELKEKGEQKNVSFYTIGEFEDLCRGPHVDSTGKVGAFKLIRVAGAYWRGDEKREMLTRIYGVAFSTQEELDEYLNRQEEAKRRDHRKLGRELDLFCFSDLVGVGLPLFTPRGTVLRDKMSDYSLSLRAKAGFSKVWTPHITKMDLYKKSGHFAKFGDELFVVHSQVNGEKFAMKPMNCPHHAQIFASRPRTYKEMPVRYMEATTDYRDERTGELGGLSRVRSLTQDDSHVFCRKEQIFSEIEQLILIVKKLYETMGMAKMRARLSYRDSSDKYLGDISLWDMAQAQLREAAVANGLDFFEEEGEAAFYGPKIDFMAEDAIGREHQVATVQLDFVQPERFELEFVNEEGKKERPVMIHHATLGSIERFLSVFIEHTGGWFPFWCAPEQVRIITVNKHAENYALEIEQLLKGFEINEPLKHNELRLSLDISKDNLGKKIRRTLEMKIPVVIVVGPKDVENRELTVKMRDNEQKIKFDELIDFLKSVK